MSGELVQFVWRLGSSQNKMGVVIYSLILGGWGGECERSCLPQDLKYMTFIDTTTATSTRTIVLHKCACKLLLATACLSKLLSLSHSLSLSLSTYLLAASFSLGALAAAICPAGFASTPLYYSVIATATE